ncbi:MAG: acyl-CoA thioesterase [Gammaproteobacteria bacterium]|nr:acyl-CoA thioesterase [Gammaproteobacteria bacterium]
MENTSNTNGNATRLPSDREPTIRLVPMPSDTNAAGDIFGGWIMSQVDIAGSIQAHRHVKGRVVTVAVNEFQFHQPVFVGDLVSCYATVTKTGRTSVTVFVEVYAERRRSIGECIKVTEATVIYVAIDENRQPKVIETV